jgi:hypothetical protein
VDLQGQRGHGRTASPWWFVKLRNSWYRMFPKSNCISICEYLHMMVKKRGSPNLGRRTNLLQHVPYADQMIIENVLRDIE